jgi:hypothetical protein
MQAVISQLMCPQCGWRYEVRPDRGTAVVPPHVDEGKKEVKMCPGSFQSPRDPETDTRPLWKDQPR